MDYDMGYGVMDAKFWRISEIMIESILYFQINKLLINFCNGLII